MPIERRVQYPEKEVVTHDLDTIVQFGMFKGKTCREILGFTEGARGANWLEWAHNTIPWFDITNDLEAAIQEELDDAESWWDWIDPYDFMD